MSQHFREGGQEPLQEQQSGQEPLQCTPGKVCIVVFPSELIEDMLDIEKARARWNGRFAHWIRWKGIDRQVCWSKLFHAAMICVRRWQRQPWERCIRWFPVQTAFNTWRGKTYFRPGLVSSSSSEVEHSPDPSASSESSDSEVEMSAWYVHERIRVILADRRA